MATKKKGKEYYNLMGYYLYDKNKNVKIYFDNSHRLLEYDGEYLYNKKWNGKGYDKN